MSRRIVAAVAALAVVVAGVYLVKKALESDETRIRNAIAKFESSVESGSTLGFMAGVDNDYTDSGRLDYAMLKGVAYQVFKRFEVLELEITEPEIRIDADARTATAHFNCSLRASASAGGEAVDLVGRELRAPLIVLKFVERNGRWKVVASEYGPGAKAPGGPGGAVGSGGPE